MVKYYMKVMDLLSEKYHPEHFGIMADVHDKVEQIIASESRKVILQEAKKAGQKTGFYCYGTIQKRVNSERDLLLRILRGAEPSEEAAELFCSLYKKQDTILLYDKNGTIHELRNNKGARKQIAVFLRDGHIPENLLIDVTDDRRTMIIHEMKKEWNYHQNLENGRNAAAGLLWAGVKWSFDLSECDQPYTFVQMFLEPENGSVGYKAISKGLRIAAQKNSYFDALLENNENEKLKAFLRPRTVIHIGSTSDRKPVLKGITIAPNLNTIINDITDSLEVVLLRHRTRYTLTDVLFILGRYAHKTTMGDQKYYILTEEDDPYRDLFSYASEAGLLEVNESSIRFTHKNIRIILAARFHALLDNQLAHAYEPVRIYNVLSNLIPGRPDYLKDYGFDSYKADEVEGFVKSHYDVSFNWAAIYYCTYALFLEDQMRKYFFQRIIRYALDYSTLNNENGHNRRILQIKALTVISNYLLVGRTLSYEEEERLFRVAYAENMYPMQAILIKGFLKNRPYYLELIREEFAKNCVIHGGFAAGQPYFFYLQSLVEDYSTRARTFFYQAMKLQDASWKSISSDKDHVPMNLHAIYPQMMEVRDYLWRIWEREEEQEDNEDLLWYVYGVHAYAIAFADILLEKRDRKEKLTDYLQLREVQRNMGELFILADYFTRRYNILYHVGNYNSEYEPVQKMFMLCGIQRFFCQYQESYAQIMIPEQMKEKYRNWLLRENEKGVRYAFLLIRTLAHTDFEWEKVIPDAGKYDRDIFLGYDNMPDSYEDFIRELEGYRE